MANAHSVHFKIELGAGITVDRAQVNIYAITESTPRHLASLNVTESSFTALFPVSNASYFYAVAEIHSYSKPNGQVQVAGKKLQLVAVFDASSTVVAFSERQSVSTAYCFAQFLEVHDDGEVVLSDPNQAARLAYLMRGNFVATDGTLSEVIQNPPNGLESNSFPLFNFLANLTWYSILEGEVYDEFTGLTQAHSLFGALHHLALDPFVDPKKLYALIAEKKQLYRPSLPNLQPPATPIPDQWTLTIKVNDSGAENFMIGGVGNIAFDAEDRAWLANNVRQGTPNSATFCVVLEPDGSPAPFSPVFGGGLLGAGFGVTASPDRKTIYFGNYGWGPTEWNPQHGSISVFSHDGRVHSPSNGYTEGLSRVQGLGFDSQGHLWMSSWGTQDPMPPTDSKYNFVSKKSAAVVYLNGDPERVRVYPFESTHDMTFDVAFDEEGHVYVSNSGYRGDEDTDPVPSSVYKLRVVDDEIQVLEKWVSRQGCETFRQVVVEPGGDVYVGAVTTNRVIRLDRDLNFRGEFKHNIHGPWGVTIDRRGTMFIANFTREKEFTSKSELLGPYGVTLIRNGEGQEAKLMTVPTGGDEVTLANGLPLYGNPKGKKGHNLPLHSYDPIMRLTATGIDRAGNLWACNNWKPSADIDIVHGNPGGDGMVIFVGIAAPEVG